MISIAAPRAWVRPFVETGPPMLELLRELSVEAALAPDLERLLAAVAGRRRTPSVPPRIPSSSGDDSTVGPDALTNREIDVLELAVKRLQNKEIASELAISPQTVSSHLKSIYRKLDVRNRREAATRAAELGLLGAYGDGRGAVLPSSTVGHAAQRTSCRLAY